MRHHPDIPAAAARCSAEMARGQAATVPADRVEPAKPPSPAIRSYACRIKGFDYESVRHAPTAAKARYSYFLDAREPFPDLRLVDVRVRALGPAADHDGQFSAIWRHHGVAFPKLGMRVTVCGRPGRIVGVASAYLLALFDGGGEGCFHPRSDVAYFDEAGAVVAHFDTNGNILVAPPAADAKRGPH